MKGARATRIGAAVIVLSAAAVGSGRMARAAWPPYLTAWQERYPLSTLPQRMNAAAGRECYVCHHPTSVSNPGNCYREDIKWRLEVAGMTIQEAIEDLDGLDSDGDGFANGAEIMAVRTDMPGQIGYDPGLIGATGTDPCSAQPTVAVSGQRETPLPPCRADCNGDHVLTPADVACFISVWSSSLASGTLAGDFDGNGVVQTADVAAYVNAWFGGLQTGCA